MSFGELLDIKFGDLGQRQPKLICAGRDVPENVPEFVLELAARLVRYDAGVVALDLLDDIRNLTRLAGQAERRVLKVFHASRIKSRLARFGLVFFKFHIVGFTAESQRCKDAKLRKWQLVEIPN